MSAVDFIAFAIASLLVLVGGVVTVAAKNPIRGAMGLLTTIIGIAGMYLMLAAELLAAVQVLVYAGAIVILFIFVIMILGPSASSPKDARSAIPRYLGAGFFLASALMAITLLSSGESAPPQPLKDAPAGFGTIEAVGHQLFTKGVVPFEIAGLVLLIAVIGAVAVARGKQIDPTRQAASKDAEKPGNEAA